LSIFFRKLLYLLVVGKYSMLHGVRPITQYLQLFMFLACLIVCHCYGYRPCFGYFYYAVSKDTLKLLNREIQVDQKVSVHLMITVHKTSKNILKFQSLTMITYLEFGITDGVSVNLVSSWFWRSAAFVFKLN
jgi:hypothetical protein